MDIPVHPNDANRVLFPVRRTPTHFPLTRHGRDYVHAFGQITGQQEMDKLINKCLGFLHGDEKQRAMDAFERTLTLEDKRWDATSNEYHYKSVRGRWNFFMLAWCMAQGYI